MSHSKSVSDMKKIILFAAIASAMFVSCIKETAVEQKPIQLTLTASFEDLSTRASYTDNHGLKMSWDAEEAISIVTVKDDKAINLQTMTSSGTAGRKNAVFTGSFTPTDGAKYFAVYPAMSDHFDTYWSTEGQHFRIDKNSEYLTWKTINVSNLSQTGNGSLDHIAGVDAMIGQVDVVDGKANTSLVKTLSVLKLNLSLPDDIEEGGTLTCVEVKSEGFITTGTWQEFDYSTPFQWAGGGQTFVQMGLNIPAEDNGNVVIYIPGPYGKLPAGNITVSLYQGVVTCEKIIPISEELPMQAGYVYTINAEMEKK